MKKLGFVVCRLVAVVALSGLSSVAAIAADKDGFLNHSGVKRFPIGFYGLPKSDDEVQAMAKAGINIVRCGSAQDLDRAHAAGMTGWVPLPFHVGATPELRQRVTELKDHPALAVWEGPDEVIWNFTAYSKLKEIAGFTREDWWNQKPQAVEYARREAAKVIPNIRAAIAMIRELDAQNRPIWINEAAESDVIYVRRYMDVIDITGSDYYPIKSNKRDLASIGRVTDRWVMTGRGKPVWMVLQAFSWHKGDSARYSEPAYPTFAETRHMAWSSIVHGARGVMYWGAEFVDRDDFRPSIYAITAELAAASPFLVTPNIAARVRLIEAGLDNDNRKGPGVRVTVRKAGDEWLIALVNEDDMRHLGVEVSGLGGALNGRELHLLYGDETVTVEGGELTTRMQAYETKVFATSRQWETSLRTGREFE